MNPSPTAHRITTHTGQLAVFEDGAGVPVVFWPSLFSDHRLFSHVQRLLGSGWRSLRIDGPGFGRSDPPRGEVPTEAYADAVVEVLDALRIERALMVGCSWGGQIAAHMGMRAPHRVLGILMMNVPLGAGLGGRTLEVLGTRWLGSTRFWGSGVAQSMFSASSRKAHPQRVQEFISAFPSFNRKAAAITVRTTMTRFVGLEGVLPQLTVPTTILMGAEDRLYPVPRMLPIARLAPGATVEVIPQCGHLAPLEAPQAVVAALQQLAAIGGHSSTHSS